MKADDELYCKMLDWRNELRERDVATMATLQESDTWKGGDRTVFGTLAEEIDDALTACDKP